MKKRWSVGVDCGNQGWSGMFRFGWQAHRAAVRATNTEGSTAVVVKHERDGTAVIKAEYVHHDGVGPVTSADTGGEK